MRKLVILRGAMASGKSTFIKENNLENFTLSSDTFRLLFNSPELTTNYKEMIPQFNNKKVWDLLYQVLEERMKKGEFTIVDAVHARSDELSTYKKLAEKYRYRLYILDFTNVPKEEVYRRNASREEYKIVPKESIDRVYKIFAKDKIPKIFKIVSIEDFNSIIHNEPRDLNTYKSIHVFGDVHASIEPLKQYFSENPIREDEAYIFTGDYFDRGLDNISVFNFLKDLINKKNFIFLIGNHEDRLYKYACGEEFKIDYDIKKTIDELEVINLSKSEIRGFIKSLSQISYITFRDKTYIISHGGISYFPSKPLEFYSTNSFVYGIDKYEVNIDQIYDDYMKKNDEKVYQIHGHRNHFKVGVMDYEFSYNLDDNIENGGNLVILNIDDKGRIDYTKIQNKKFNENLQEETDCYNLICDLRKSKYVYEKDLGNNIFSFNFTKEAFYNKTWNDLTTTARGLFVDVDKYKVVARSYEKFFKINERIETKIEQLEKSLVFPINVYVKYNGFLGILSVLNDELFFATKSSNTGDYVEYFKNIFYKKFNEEERNVIKNYIKENNVSLVFEVLDPVNDSHIIYYEEEDIILLDIIYNLVQFKTVPYTELEKVRNDLNLKIKTRAFILNNQEEFKKMSEEVVTDGYQYDSEYIEGFVLEDSNKFMVKIKTRYYSDWKFLRSRMEEALKNNNFKPVGKSDLENTFMKYLENKYYNRDCNIDEVKIVKEREEFLKSTND